MPKVKSQGEIFSQIPTLPEIIMGRSVDGMAPSSDGHFPLSTRFFQGVRSHIQYGQLTKSDPKPMKSIEMHAGLKHDMVVSLYPDSLP